MNLYLSVDDSEKQILYYWEKPVFHFKSEEKSPYWDVIRLEIPTRMISCTEEWISLGHAKSVRISKYKGDRAIESWLLRDVEIKSSSIQKSKLMSLKVMEVIIAFKDAQPGEANAVL